MPIEKVRALIRRRRPLVSALALALVVMVGALSLPFSVGPGVKKRLIAAIADEFESSVEIETLTFALLPRPRVTGRGLVLRHKHRTDVPPLITIRSFSAGAGLLGFFRTPVHVAAVTLDGLEINVPPGGLGVADGGNSEAGHEPKRSPLVVNHLDSRDAVLRILRREPGKTPREFNIRTLVMNDVGADHPWSFEADLTNPKPPGDIRSKGTFGPWNADDPARTPLAAEYEFARADLGVFKGIQGILSSSGRFHGVLERIEADGETHVPEFALADVGNAVALETRFHSIIDGTNGNTLLQPVDARFLRTSIHTSGGVIEREGQQGRTTSLDIVLDDARLEDVLHLAVKGDRAPMSGTLTLKASFVMPPGKEDGMIRLRMDGTFVVANARFGAPGVQQKVNEFSTKARGVKDDTPDPVVSSFTGRFNMRSGVIHFPAVAFSMPGAHVNVSGSYVMKSQALDFRGTVRLDARLSQLTSGVRGAIVHLFEGLFRHDNVTVVPITIDGTAREPKVRLDVSRVVKGG